LDQVIQAGQIKKLLLFTRPGEPQEVRARAMAAIEARPDHEAELVGILSEKHFEYGRVDLGAMTDAVRSG
jgi:hypothetical protein